LDLRGGDDRFLRRRKERDWEGEATRKSNSAKNMRGGAEKGGDASILAVESLMRSAHSFTLLGQGRKEKRAVQYRCLEGRGRRTSAENLRGKPINSNEKLAQMPADAM